MNRHPQVALLSLLPLLGVGCKGIGQIKDAIEGATSSFVVEATFIGVEPPDDESITAAVAQTEFGSGARILAFTADASNASEIANTPIGSLDLRLSAGGASGLKLAEGTEGEYSLTGDEGLTYESGSDAILSTTWSETARSVSASSPPAPQADGLAGSHPAGQALTVDLSGQGFDRIMVFVLNAGSGEVTFNNSPTDIADLYDFGGGDGPTEVIEIPASALGEESVYAVGVAGLINAESTDYSEMNNLLSNFFVGKMQFHPVCTHADSALCEQ